MSGPYSSEKTPINSPPPWPRKLAVITAETPTPTIHATALRRRIAGGLYRIDFTSVPET